MEVLFTDPFVRVPVEEELSDNGKPLGAT